MTHKSVRTIALLLAGAVALSAAQARATQYILDSTHDAGMHPESAYPSASNNYVSVPGSSPYANPYEVPAATATSYKPVSVPGSGQDTMTYQPVSVPPSGQDSMAYQPVSEAPPVNTLQPTTNTQPVSVPGNASSYQPAPEQPMQPVKSYPQYPAVASAASPTFDNSYRGINETPSAPPPPDTYTTTTSGLHFGGGQNVASVSELPNFNYEPDLDPKNNPPYKAPSAEQNTPGGDANWHPYMGLETRSGIELGGQFFYYSYAEPDLSVTQTGEPFGITATGTYNFRSFFATADARYMFGDVDYDGTGTIKDAGLDSWELRGLFGKDFTITREYSLSPYIGIAYRTLFNDNRGVSSTGAAGYRRYNELYYLPIGVYPRTHIDTNSRLAAMLEYDFVLHGNQKSYLADANFGDPNLNNGQSSGYGVRGNIMYETKTWALGPFFTYWSIDQSKAKNAVDNSALSCAGVGGAPCFITSTEPANHTFEAGIQFKYHFF